MELRQLQYLVDVIDEGSFTKAAAKAFVAQPGVSAQVRRLERELALTLLDRSGTTVTPTEAGEAILPFARAALNAVAGVRQTADAFAGLVRGHLTVGMVTSISTPRVDVPALIAGFHGPQPGIEVTLVEAPSGQLVGALRGGRVDVALIGLGAEPPTEDLAYRVVATEPVVVAVGPAHPLASHKTVTLATVAEHDCITLPEGTGVRSQIDAALGAAELSPRIAFEAGDPRLLAQLASEGLGVALLPASAADVERRAIRRLTLTGAQLEGRIALAWRADRPSSPATKAFLDHAAHVMGG